MFPEESEVERFQASLCSQRTHWLTPYVSYRVTQECRRRASTNNEKEQEVHSRSLAPARTTFYSPFIETVSILYRFRNVAKYLSEVAIFSYLYLLISATDVRDDHILNP